MKDWKKFISGKTFLAPLLAFLLFDLCLETDIYKPYLKKNSYAANVNRILNHTISMKEKHDPEILVMGTSVAFQGLSPRILQEKIELTGKKIQSIAVPGSELVVQHLVAKKALENFQKVKLLVYIAEFTMPWVSKTDLTLPTLAMLGEFPKKEAINTINEFQYNLKYDDLGYILFKAIAYRRDLKDFLTDPNKRFKHINKTRKNPNLNFYDYENDKKEKISSYEIKSLEECLAKTKGFGEPPYPNSSFEHKKAIFETCDLGAKTINYIAEETKKSGSTETKETRLYFERLNKIFSQFREKNISILVVFAPYSATMNGIYSKERMDYWETELKKIQGTNSQILDLQNIFLGKDSNEFCYDTIHLNQDGMKMFSRILGERLAEKMKEYINEK
ncbi:MAG: hypothetical protein SFU98_12555 [Leptospiraceae bacterium]|nr:hypothetical protein [Leptospiraceae bacterium]